jgi:hypothetical protein
MGEELEPTLHCVKMRIGKGPRLSAPVHEEGIFLHLEEKRRVRRLIPEEGKRKPTRGTFWRSSPWRAPLP